MFNVFNGVQAPFSVNLTKYYLSHTEVAESDHTIMWEKKRNAEANRRFRANCHGWELKINF